MKGKKKRQSLGCELHPALKAKTGEHVLTGTLGKKGSRHDKGRRQRNPQKVKKQNSKLVSKEEIAGEMNHHKEETGQKRKNEGGGSPEGFPNRKK